MLSRCRNNGTQLATEEMGFDELNPLPKSVMRAQNFILHLS
jgi:hypothetical protein